MADQEPDADRPGDPQAPSDGTAGESSHHHEVGLYRWLDNLPPAPDQGAPTRVP